MPVQYGESAFILHSAPCLRVSSSKMRCTSSSSSSYSSCMPPSFTLTNAQRDAVRRRNVLALIAAGGNVYYLAKFAGIFGLSVQDIGAQQTGMPVEDFKAMLLAKGK